MKSRDELLCLYLIALIAGATRSQREDLEAAVTARRDDPLGTGADGRCAPAAHQVVRRRGEGVTASAASIDLFK